MELCFRNADMRSFFNEKADGYDAVHGQKELYDTKRALVNKIPDGTERFLDLGIGTGLELTLLFERFPNAEVSGVDISENMLAELCRRPFAEKVKTVNGDFFMVDFLSDDLGGEKYDAVISSSALHHFTPDDKRGLYEKVYDCLKQGGCFVNADYIYETLDEEKWIFENYERLLSEYRHVDTPLAAETEARLLKVAGFKSVEIESLENPRYKLIFAKR